MVGSNEIQTASRLAVLETQVTDIKGDLGEIKTSVQAMQGAFQQGHGAARILLGLFGILTGIVASVVTALIIHYWGLK